MNSKSHFLCCVEVQQLHVSPKKKKSTTITLIITSIHKYFVVILSFSIRMFCPKVGNYRYSGFQLI